MIHFKLKSIDFEEKMALFEYRLSDEGETRVIQLTSEEAESIEFQLGVFLSEIEDPDNTGEVDCENEVETFTSPDGRVVIIYPDGTATVSHLDGSVEVQFPDGTITTTFPNNKTVVWAADGTGYNLRPDGTLLKVV